MPGDEGTRILDRYVLYKSIAAGGMATVHLGRTIGAAGFTRVVGIKRLHPHLAQDPEFVSMLLDEARLAARIRHPNIVQTIDVAATQGELFVIMEYVHGESLARLIRAAADAKEDVPLGVAVTIAAGILHGLHAAHEAKTEHGQPLEIVHRDVSPQNVMVGADGIARVLDFGVAKAAVRIQTTREGQLKGKIAYMAPEQLRRATVDRRTDVYAASVVIWEMCAGRRLFKADDEAGVVEQILVGMVDPPSKYAPSLPERIDQIILRGLDPDPQKRFQTAEDMALELEAVAPPARSSEVGAWVARMAGEKLRLRSDEVSKIEREGTYPSSAELRLGMEDTVAAGPEAVPPRRSRRWPLPLGLAAAAVMVAGAGLALVRRDVVPEQASVPTTESSAVATVAPPSSLDFSAATTATATPPAPPASTVTPPPIAHVVHPPRPPKPPVDECAIPFTIGADGSKVYKRNCLR